MSLGKDEFDQLAYALARSDEDVLEQEGFRAEWTESSAVIRVTNRSTGTSIDYDAEDVVRATSEIELQNARLP
jgi:hypothetical protein